MLNAKNLPESGTPMLSSDTTAPVGFLLSLFTFVLLLILAWLFEGPRLTILIGCGFLAHELGHWIASRRLGIGISWPIYLPAIGSILFIRDSRSPGHFVSVVNTVTRTDSDQRDLAAIVAMSGSVLGMCCAGLFLCLWKGLGSPLFADAAAYCATWNLVCIAPCWFDGRYSTARIPLIQRLVLTFSVAASSVIAKSAVVLAFAILFSIPSLKESDLSKAGTRNVAITGLLVVVAFSIILTLLGRGNFAIHSAPFPFWRGIW